MKGLTRTLLAAWIVLLVFDGLIRFACTAASVPWLAYLKDGVLVGLLGLFVVRAASRLRLHLVVLATLALMIYGALVGLLLGASLVAVAFAVKMFLPFVAGYLAESDGYLDTLWFRRLYRWLGPVAALGVLLDLVLEFPWSGLSYDFAGMTLEASRQWTTFGLQRPAGFGRSSFESAIALYTLIILRFGIRPGGQVARDALAVRMYDALVAVFTMTAIAATTSKTSILALCLLGVAFLLRAGTLHRLALFGRASRIALSAMMAFALVLTLTPFLIPEKTAGRLDDTLSEYGVVPKLMFLSLVERAQDVWPRAAHSMSRPLLTVTGRGLGGVGAPQLYFAPDQYNPADNVHVYLWLCFGMLIVALLVVGLAVLIGRLARAPADLALVSFLATTLAFGATLNVIEAPMLMLGLGILLAAHESARNHGH